MTLYFETDYVSCSLYGPDKFELKLKHVPVYPVTHMFIFKLRFHMMEILGNLLDKCSMQIQVHIGTNLEYGGLTGDNATYFGYIKPYYFNTSTYAASVILLTFRMVSN